MAVMGMNSQKSRIYLKGNEAGDVFEMLEAITSINGPDGSSNDLDITHLMSDAREYLAGLADFGSISIDGNFLDEVRAPVQRKLFEMYSTTSDPVTFRLAMPTTSKLEEFIVFELLAAVTSFTTTQGVDEKNSFSATLRISGAVTRTDNVAAIKLTENDMEA